MEQSLSESTGPTSPQSARAIEADIEATRERMGDTLEELGARLNPRRLKQDAVASVREATVGRVERAAKSTAKRAAEASRSTADVVRRRPLPVAMIALGIAVGSLLVYSATRKRSRMDRLRSYWRD